MSTFEVLEPAIDPNNRITFLLDWELTMKCNLDCSYCDVGLYGGHDNSTKHPPLAECLETLDFMFSYTDLYMQYKPAGLKYAILNIYGGESLHHPNIVDILKEIQEKYSQYKDRWHLTVTTTTNAIVSSKKMESIIPYIDEFTVSYHTDSTDKQKEQFKDNLLLIAEHGKRIKCVVLMHTQPDKFADSENMIAWLSKHNIKMLPRQLDLSLSTQKTYNQYQVKWFNDLYKSKTNTSYTEIDQSKLGVNLSDVGRACCGGRQTCQNQNYKERSFYVLDNKFPDWYCSVNWFFLYVKQVNGEVFVNKDCKMNFNNEVGPIGLLKESDSILNDLKSKLKSGNLPIIQCKKRRCLCGLCAPKAKDLEVYNKIITKYQKDYCEN